MNTLTINNKAALTLARAAEKARVEKPLVRKTATYGVYAVTSSDKTREYKVTCNSDTKTITCNCKATKPCYHIAAVAPLHSYIARQKQEVEAAAQAATPACTFSPVEVAQAQAEQALVELEKSWPVSEIEEFIAENSASLERECPVCGLVQPDDDSSDCWACGAALNPEDVYTAEMEAKDRADLFG